MHRNMDKTLTGILDRKILADRFVLLHRLYAPELPDPVRHVHHVIAFLKIEQALHRRSRPDRAYPPA